MINASKIWRSLVAAALVAGTVATMLPTAAFATQITAAASFGPTATCNNVPAALPANCAAAVAAYAVTATNPAPAERDFSPGTASEYTAVFTVLTSVPTGAGAITIVPAGVTVPATAAFVGNQPTIKCSPVCTGATLVAVSAGGVGASIALTLGTTAVPAASTVTIVFPLSAGLLNPIPTTNGTNAFVATVATSADTTVTSFPALSSGIVATATPNTPGAAAQYNFVFINTATLVNNVDSIVIKVPVATNTTGTAIGVLPSTISKSNVVISGTTTATAAPSTQQPTSDPVVDTIAGTITIKVPNMSLGLASGVGANLAANTIGINATTVSFNAAAGITNSAGAAGLVFSVTTSQDATVYPGTATIPRVLQLNATNGARGTSLTITGLGYTNGTATVWADNGKGAGTACDGTINGGEVNLAPGGVTVANRTFTTTVVVGVAFLGGLPGTAFPWANTNCIAAFDGGGSKMVAGPTAPTSVGGEPTFVLNPSLASITPTSGTIGTSVSAVLQDYTVGGVCVSGKVGAITVACSAMTSNPTVDANGNATYVFAIPGGVQQGANTLNVKAETPAALLAGAAADSASKTFTVNGANVSVTPSNVAGNQKILIQGTGFNASTAITTGVGVTIGGTAIALCPPASTTTDTGGSVSFSCTMPITAPFNNSGSYTLTVTDAGGAAAINGSVTVVVPAPTLVISPTTNAAGSTITFSGVGMSAASSVTINYPFPVIAGGTSTVVTSDSAGNYSGSLVIPTTPVVVLGTTYTVQAASGTLTATAQSAIPAPSLKISATAAAPGDSVTITGTGFASFTGVTTLTIGGLGVTVTAVNTDGSGGFSTTVLVPGLSAGSSNVIATVGGNTASTVLNITAQTATVPATTALAALVNTQNLNIVTSFNYGSGAYQAYVPNLGGNTLTAIAPNTVLFITMTKDTTVIVSGISYAVKANVPTPIGVGAVVSVAVQ